MRTALHSLSGRHACQDQTSGRTLRNRGRHKSTGAALSTGEPRDATSSMHRASSLFKAPSVFTERPV